MASLAVLAAQGSSKDGRTDLRQLGWILTVATDRAVPPPRRVTDGTIEDPSTHIAPKRCSANCWGGTTSCACPPAGLVCRGAASVAPAEPRLWGPLLSDLIQGSGPAAGLSTFRDQLIALFVIANTQGLWVKGGSGSGGKASQGAGV